MRGMNLDFDEGQWWGEVAPDVWVPLAIVNPSLARVLERFDETITPEQLAEAQRVAEGLDTQREKRFSSDNFPEALGEAQGKPAYWDKVRRLLPSIGDWPPYLPTDPIEAMRLATIGEEPPQGIDWEAIGKVERYARDSGLITEELPQLPPAEKPPLRFVDVLSAQAAADQTSQALGTPYVVKVSGGFYTIEPATPTNPAGRLSANQVLDDLYIEYARTNDKSLLNTAAALFQARAQVEASGGLTYFQAVQYALPHADTYEEAQRWVTGLMSGRVGIGPTVIRQEQARERSKQDLAAIYQRAGGQADVSGILPQGGPPALPTVGPQGEIPGLPTGPFSGQAVGAPAATGATAATGPFSGQAVGAPAATGATAATSPFQTTQTAPQAPFGPPIPNAMQTTTNMLAQGIPFTQTPLGVQAPGQAFDIPWEDLPPLSNQEASRRQAISARGGRGKYPEPDPRTWTNWNAVDPISGRPLFSPEQKAAAIAGWEQRRANWEATGNIGRATGLRPGQEKGSDAEKIAALEPGESVELQVGHTVTRPADGGPVTHIFGEGFGEGPDSQNILDRAIMQQGGGLAFPQDAQGPFQAKNTTLATMFEIEEKQRQEGERQRQEGERQRQLRSGSRTVFR